MTSKTAAQDDTAFLGHPRALGFLAFSEAWERFSYYGMQSLLVLYMTKQLLLSPQVDRIAGFPAFHGFVEAIYHPGASIQAVASAIFGACCGMPLATIAVFAKTAAAEISQKLA